MFHRFVIAFSLGLLTIVASHAEDGQLDGDAGQWWAAGGFLFSDEKGGFLITDISGSGTARDPIVIKQQIQSIGPSILTIRYAAAAMINSHIAGNLSGLHLRLETANVSRGGWIGFEVQLQEELGKPSPYGDGLSFDQVLRRPNSISSDQFRSYEIEYEPGDTLIYQDGVLDDPHTAIFNFYIIDLTPVPIFYISQRPRLPAS